MGNDALVPDLLSSASGANSSATASSSSSDVSDIQVSTVLHREQLDISNTDVSNRKDDIAIRSPSPLIMGPPTSLPATFRTRQISLPPSLDKAKRAMYGLGIQPIASSSRSSSPSSDASCSWSLRSSRGSTATLAVSSPRLKFKDVSPQYNDSVTIELEAPEHTKSQALSSQTDNVQVPPSTGSSDSSTRAPNTPIDALNNPAVDIAVKQIKRKNDNVYRRFGPRHLEYDYALARMDFSAVFVQALSDNGYVLPSRKLKTGPSSAGPSQNVIGLAKEDWGVKKAARALDKADDMLEAALSRGEFWENTPPPPEMCWGSDALKDLEWARLPPEEVSVAAEEERVVELRRSQRIRRPRDLSLQVSDGQRRARRSLSRDKESEQKCTTRKRRFASTEHEVSDPADTSTGNGPHKRRRKV